MTITDQEKLIRMIVRRLKHIERRITTLEERVNSLQTQVRTKQGGHLPHRIAEEVYTVVGLKEALTGPRHVIRYIWAALLCLGLAATIYYIYSTASEYLDTPTATNVELHRPATYEYPYVVVCGWGWYDVEKGLSNGLTMDAIKYSLSYYTDFISDDGVDIGRANLDFKEYYRKKNYSNLLHYYRDMATDLVDMSDNLSSFSDIDESCYYCNACANASRVDKVPVNQAICYAFTLESVDSVHSHGYTEPNIMIKMQDKSRIVLDQSSNFQVYLMQNKNLTVPDFPAIAMEPFTAMTVRTSQQTFISFPDPDQHPCKQADQMEANYSAERCRTECLGKLFRNHFGCYDFQYTADRPDLGPAEYCNRFDKLPSSNKTFGEVVDNQEYSIISSEEGSECFTRCAYPCKRTILTSTLDSKYSIKASSFNVSEKAKDRNMILLDIKVVSDALSIGGIMTFTEVRTFSLSTLISNVGGTLGLFVGGTLLTFFQVIMFGINYLLDRKERRRVVKPVQQNGT